MQNQPLEALNILASNPVGKVAICAPHPDDEVIGASSLLLSLRDHAFVFYLTDGAPNYLLQDDYDPGQYAKVRRREAEQVLSFCGIPLQNAFWLNLSDQRASYELNRLTAEIRRIVLEVRPDVIVTPPYEGGHPDHDSAALATAVACAAEGSPQHLEMLSYHSRGGRLECDRFLPPPNEVPQRRVLLSPEECSRKAVLFALYASQREVLHNFPIGEELFRVAPDYYFLEPPHPGKLYYDFFSWGIDGSNWRERARMFLQNSAQPLP
jgi:N-acetylglucosamine malate deacetylase 2